MTTVSVHLLEEFIDSIMIDDKDGNRHLNDVQAGFNTALKEVLYKVNSGALTPPAQSGLYEALKALEDEYENVMYSEFSRYEPEPGSAWAKAREALANTHGQPQDGWIAVSERLPKELQVVIGAQGKYQYLMCLVDGIWRYPALDRDGKAGYHGFFNSPTFDPTHWREFEPLPPPTPPHREKEDERL